MTYIPKSSPMLKDLQDKMGKILEDRAEASKNYKPSPITPKELNEDIRIQPTEVDILLMDEYSRGVYQGD